MKVGGKLLATAVVATGLVVPATANATVLAKITDDAGTPVALAEGAPPSLRNMDVRYYVNTDEGVSFSATVLGPDGLPTGVGITCGSKGVESNRSTDYHGNGVYTLQVTVYSDIPCAKPTRTVSYTWNVAAGVAIAPPAPTMLTRQPNSFSTITQLLAFSGNPGASTYEIRYAKGGVLAPDGSISGPVGNGYVDSATGQVQLIGLREPGAYTVVARAKNGDYYSPWSAPVTLTLLAPFDMTGITTLDRKGPSYKLRGTLGEPSAGGRVTISIAKGKTGKRFRVLGKPKVNSKGQWTLRFTVRKYGSYRMRYSYKGSSTVAKGTIYATVRIRKVFR